MSEDKYTYYIQRRRLEDGYGATTLMRVDESGNCFKWYAGVAPPNWMAVPPRTWSIQDTAEYIFRDIDINEVKFYQAIL